MWVALRLVLTCCYAVLTSVLEPCVNPHFVDEQRPVSVVAVDHVTCVHGVCVVVGNPLAPQVVGFERFEVLHVLSCVGVAGFDFAHDCFPLASLKVFPPWEVALSRPNMFSRVEPLL